MSQTTWQIIHTKALQCAENFRRSEAELLEILIEVDRHKIWQHLGLTSTFKYCTLHLKLSDDTAFNFIRVVRRSQVVPELKHAVCSGTLNISRAKKIAAVITPENQAEWISKAVSLPPRQLEREVVRVCPTLAVPERLKPISYNQNEFRCSIDDEADKSIRRVQDILSQKKSGVVSMGECVKILAEFYLDRVDPLRVAHRQQRKADRVTRANLPLPNSKSRETAKPNLARKSATGLRPPAQTDHRYQSNHHPKRITIPAAVRHAIALRDQTACQFRIPGHGICGSERWIDRHHRKFARHGGANHTDNLVTLCRAHHHLWHQIQARHASPSLAGSARPVKTAHCSKAAGT